MEEIAVTSDINFLYYAPALDMSMAIGMIHCVVMYNAPALSVYDHRHDLLCCSVLRPALYMSMAIGLIYNAALCRLPAVGRSLFGAKFSRNVLI